MTRFDFSEPPALSTAEDPLSLKRYLERAYLHPLTVGPRLLGLDDGITLFGPDEAKWRKEGCRVLTAVYPDQTEHLDAMVKLCFSQIWDAQISCGRDALHMPADGIIQLDLWAMNRLKVNSIHQFSRALRTSVLDTAEEAMRLLTGQKTKRARFLHSALVPSACWDVYTLNKPHEECEVYKRLILYGVPDVAPVYNPIARLGADTAMVVICVPPSYFGPEDFLEFTKISKISDDRETENTLRSPAETLWAALSEACTRLQCEFFTVTSYDNWTFGDFTESKRGARHFRYHTSPTTEMQGARPTIIQIFTFWCLLARGFAGPWAVPREEDFPLTFFSKSECKYVPSYPGLFEDTTPKDGVEWLYVMQQEERSLEGPKEGDQAAVDEEKRLEDPYDWVSYPWQEPLGWPGSSFGGLDHR